jgi:DNA-binding LacI/PurR family transcriptional regulator
MARSAGSAPTMQDVARLAGVSAKTVSNVLANYEHVSFSMRQRVMSAVRELDYEINVSARNLRSGRTRVIGLAVPELSQAYFAELADAVIRAAAARGYTVLIEQTGADLATEISAIAAMRRHSIDGLIFSPLALGPEEAKYLDVDFPLVVLGERIPNSAADHITMSNVAAVRAATEHLLALGRRRIAVIGAYPHDPVGTGALRLQGYEQAVNSYGIDVDPALVVTVPLWHRIHGAEAIERLLATGVDFDAAVCFNDALALGAMRVLQRNGRRIPEDVAVTGFDDIEDSRFWTPTLTTISPGRDQSATLAVDMLTARIEGTSERNDPAEVEVQYSLIIRESTVGASPT